MEGKLGFCEERKQHDWQEFDGKDAYEKKKELGQFSIGVEV